MCALFGSAHPATSDRLAMAMREKRRSQWSPSGLHGTPMASSLRLGARRHRSAGTRGAFGGVSTHRSAHRLGERLGERLAPGGEGRSGAGGDTVRWGRGAIDGGAEGPERPGDCRRCFGKEKTRRVTSMGCGGVEPADSAGQLGIRRTTAGRPESSRIGCFGGI